MKEGDNMAEKRWNKMILVGVDTETCEVLGGSMIGEDICELDNDNGKYSIVKRKESG